MTYRFIPNEGDTRPLNTQASASTPLPSILEHSYRPAPPPPPIRYHYKRTHYGTGTVIVFVFVGCVLGCLLGVLL